MTTPTILSIQHMARMDGFATKSYLKYEEEQRDEQAEIYRYIWQLFERELMLDKVEFDRCLENEQDAFNNEFAELSISY